MKDITKLREELEEAQDAAWAAAGAAYAAEDAARAAGEAARDAAWIKVRELKEKIAKLEKLS